MEEKVVVSLSSIPPRFSNLGKTLKCLLDQVNPADEIQLYLPRSYRRFPEHSFFLPEVPEGITVKIVDHDLGPATKVLYCAKAHWGTKTRIVYCDDDRLPDRTWLKRFIEVSKKNPDKAIASSGWHLNRYGINNSITRFPRAIKKGINSQIEYVGKRICQKLKESVYQKSFQKPSRVLNFRKSGYIDIAEGYGGVSIKPDFFDEESFDIPPVLWTVDDIWLSGILECRGIGIWVENKIRIPVRNDNSNIESLAGSTIDRLRPNSASKYGIEYFQKNFSIWM